MSWPAAFLLTLAVEAPCVAAVARLCRFGPPVRVGGAALVVNAVSHPLLWFVLAPGLGALAGYGAGVLLAEVAVIALEACGYAVLCRLRVGPALVLAVAGNVATVLVAVLLYVFA